MAPANTISSRQQLEQAIAAQESLRGTLDDGVIDATIAALQEKLNSLSTDGQTEQQKKQVSLLFMDIVGSTSIVRNLDPEDNLAIMEQAMKRMAAPIEEHGGHVARYMGDGFKAVFGHPEARENDPDRAVLAGLGILEAAKEFRQDVENQWGIHDFDVRVGINTGLVVIGGQSEAEDTITGTAVNLAARIESAAEPGTVLISTHTYQNVQDSFDLEPKGPIQAKGFDEPVAVFRVLRAKPRTFRSRRYGVEGVEIPMLGREAELISLKEAFYTAIEDHERQMVTIMGEAGIGKSRLLYEFDQWVDLNYEGVRVYQGRAHLQVQGVPYGLLRELLASRFEIKDDDRPEVVFKKFTAGINEVLGAAENAEMKAHFIGQLVGYNFRHSPHLQDVLENPQLIRDRGFDYLVEYFKAVSNREGILVLLDDLQWSDDSSLDVLVQLALQLPNQPLFFVTSARRDLLERRPHWGEGQEFHLRLDLHPLNKRNSRMLVEEALQKVVEIPAALRDLVVSKAEGNPFYVEELLKMLVDDRVVIKDEPAWQVDLTRLAEVRVPTTLTGVLQARLESLPTKERTMLQQSSVVGRVFWDAVVIQLNKSEVGGLEEVKAQERLLALREKEMVFQRETSVFSGAHEYIFKHAILREVTYESVLKQPRQDYHALVAEWLIENSRDREGEFLGLIADHLVQAGKTEQAINYLQKAGQEASARYANHEALVFFSRAIDLADQSTLDGADRASLYRDRGLVHETQGDFESARDDFEYALQLARLAGELKGEWRAQLDLGKLWASRNYSKTYDYFAQALELAHQIDDPALLARSLNRMGNWYANADYTQEANSYHQEALKIFEQLGDRPGLAGTLDLLGMANTLSGDTFALVEYSDRAIELFRELDDQPNLASSLMVRSITRSLYEYYAVIQTASPGEGRRYLDEALQITLENDFRAGQSLATWFLGLWEGLIGRYGSAIEALESGLRIATDIEHRQWMAANLNGLAMVYIYLLEGEKARQYSEQALSLSREVQSLYWTQLAAGSLAKAYLLLGDPAQGQVYLEEEIDDQTSMHTIGKRYCWSRRAELALAQHEPKLALKIVERVIDAIPDMSPGRLNTSLWRLRGETLLELRRTDEAEPVLHAALDNARTIGEEYIIWRIHAIQGRLYQRTDRQADAEKAFAASRDAIEILAANIPDKELRTNFRHRANETLGNPL